MEAATASSSGQHSAKDLVSGLLGTRLKASHEIVIGIKVDASKLYANHYGCGDMQ